MAAPSAIPQSAFGFIDFCTASPSPFHVVETSRQILFASGFKQIHENQSWDGIFSANGKYFFTRNQSSLIAFVVGGKYKPGNGFTIVAAHTDSPCLKLKPRSSKKKAGFLQLGVQCYGGGLWHTWFDRDLGVAGRVVLRPENNAMVSKLVHLGDPILRIPTLAIHLDRDVKDAFKFNTETHLTPVLCSDRQTQDAESTPSVLLQAMATHLGCAPEAILDMELCLYDTQPPTVGGLLGEYLFSARCDNLVMSFCALHGLTQAGQCKNSSNINMVALFDNEEVGSLSAYGADSHFLPAVLKRITSSFGTPHVFEESMSKSLLVSADMAHAQHPNYPEKHEDQHTPKLNHGVVLKYNANQRYATTSVTSAILKVIAEKTKVPLQSFVVRNDSPCGSTIGPILASKLGMRTIDLGNPQLSMHSIREQVGVNDIDHAIRLFTGCFEEYGNLEAQLQVD